jgi:acetoin utilization deacetylase AcuC-like enzyme
VRPDLVLYDAGVDPHMDDALGKLALTDAGLLRRDCFVLETCVRRGIPVTTVIGGGYSMDIDALARRHTLVHRAASEMWKSV